jgi:hypothetical protein
LWGGGDKIYNLRGNNYAPFRVQYIEQKLMVMDYYNPELQGTDGLEVCDIITHINGKTVEFIIDSLKKYYPASNDVSVSCYVKFSFANKYFLCFFEKKVFFGNIVYCSTVSETAQSKRNMIL